ncbi:MAG: hypothetical protein ABW022_06075 [Actinoplanes sp.]
MNPPRKPSMQAQGPEVQDLVTLLLHTAVQASHALDRMHHLAVHSPDADPAAAATLADAMEMICQARVSLQRNADQLTDQLTNPPPHCP